MFLGNCVTAEGRYDLDSLDPASVEGELFLKYLLANRQVIYDWGNAYFYACKEKFRVDYQEGAIVRLEDGVPIKDDQWIGYDPRAESDLLKTVFVGEWGPTSADVLSRFLNSGVEVDIYNNAEGGATVDPKEFIESLRKKGSSDL